MDITLPNEVFSLNSLRQRFERFCYKNRNKGIPNLMFYICAGAGLLYFMSMIDPSNLLYSVLCFDPNAIMAGQIWRLVTYPLCYYTSNPLMTVISLFCYYSMGRAIENAWGTLKFNLFYLTGVVMMDVWCLIFGGWADAFYLNLSLFLAYATLYPDTQFLIFFIIPVKAWILAVFDLVLVLMGLFNAFPYNVFPLIALGNYFLFFGKDVVNVLPVAWRVNARRAMRKAKGGQRAKVIPFNNAGSYQATHTSVKAPYTHKCTICGKTDLDDPNLEFRYCSRCKGYHCYCAEHISNHVHIQ